MWHLPFILVYLGVQVPLFIRYRATMVKNFGNMSGLHASGTQRSTSRLHIVRASVVCERGLVEHINDLLRQFFPQKCNKKCNLLLVTEEEIRHAENRLNARPRKVLGFKTPQEVYNTLAAQECTAA